MASIAYIWILIPLAGVFAGIVKDYLKYREKQQRLGDSAQKIHELVEELREENDRLKGRVENLEAVVTSRLWHSTDAGASSADRARLDIALSEADAETPSAERRMRRLAQGLGI